jgi:quinoprotein glucose dehydrogenase
MMRIATRALRRYALLLSCTLLVGCERPPVDYSGPVADWPEYGHDKGGLRYSPLTQITRENVLDLQIAWTYRSGDLSDGTATTTRSSLQVTPIVVDGAMVFCTPFNRVIALDPETGKELWAFDPKLKNRDLHGGYPLTCRGVSSWRDPAASADALCSRRIFTGTMDAELIALDAKTGRPCPGFGHDGRVALREGMGDAPEWEYYVTSSPLVVHDLVVVGGLVADNIRANAPPGVVRAFDARTGALRWAFDPVPPDVAPVAATDGAKFRRGTANLWGTMSTDEQRDLLFVPTGNAPPDYFGGERHGLDYYSSSLIALQATTGKVVWRFQTVHHDLWDYDIGAQPSLFEFPQGDRTIPAVAVSTKMGHVFFLNRETGAPLFPVEERPVPQGGAPGETLSPTQPFPTRPPSLYPPELRAENAFGVTFWDRGKCRDRIAKLRADGIFTPPSLQGSIHYPSAAGGINWGGASIDPTRGIYVVNQSRVPTVVTLIPREEYDKLPDKNPPVSGALPGTTVLYGAMDGTPYAVRRELLLSPFGIPCSPPPWGTLTAVNIASGSVLWEISLGTTRDMAPFPFWLQIGVPNLGGSIVTQSGLVFIGATTDHYLRAFDIQNGAELWRARLPFGGNATPITYRLRKDGKQFVVIAAGGHVFSKQAGDAIVAFTLP